MNIAICTSFSFAKEAIEIKNDLEKLGHTVVMPHNIHLYADGTLPPETREASVENKIKYSLIRGYFERIAESDAILVTNKDKKEIKNYIGGNTFLEIGFAHVLNKKIFLLNPIPAMPYSDEISAMEVKVIDNDLAKIV